MNRLFRLLLRAFPFEFRSDYGREMEQVFRLQRREAAREGPMSVRKLWLQILSDVARTAPREHLAMLGQDLRYAVRTMMRHPAFTAVAVVTLALGIGVTTAMFSVANTVLLRPLPYADADRLVAIHESQTALGADLVEVSYPNFLTLRAAARTLERVAAVRFSEVVLRGAEDPVRLSAVFASPELFDVLRVSPTLGRAFAPDDNRPGAALTAIVSHRFWSERLGSDPHAAGRSIVILGKSATVVGVMPRGFAFPSSEIDLWLPIGVLETEPQMMNRSVHMTVAVGRLQRHATIEQARQELAAVAAGIERQYPGEDPRHSLTALPLHQQMVGSVQPAILALCGAVGFVLLVACVNVANLMLARGASRQKETAIRKALGATRLRLVRQLLTESLVVALTGGASGLLLAAWTTGFLLKSLPSGLPGADSAGSGVDGRVLAFSCAVSVLTGLLFGLAPAFRASRIDPHDDLKEQAGRIAGPSGHRLRSILVVAEIAASLVLVAGAGLMLKSFWMLQHVALGFRPERLGIVRVALPVARYQSEEAVIRFYHDLPLALKRVDGVEEVSAVNQLPVSGGDGHGDVTVEHRDVAPGEAPAASFRRILPNYFHAMGVPLLRGREFDARDGADPKVVIISDAMARRLWPAGDPIGQRIKVGPAASEPWLTVVGVVGDVRNVSLDSEPALDTYEPHAQRPWSTMNLLVRLKADTTYGMATHGMAASVAQTLRDVRAELRRIEPALLVDRIGTMDDRLGESVAPQRLNVLLLGVFASFALVLAAVGIYGLTSYAVVQRTREIGIRMALGAGRLDLIGEVVARALTLALYGILLGVPAAMALGRAIRQMLFAVQPTDAATFCAVAAGMAAVALLASWIPALRATRVDPMLALRSE